MRFLGQPTKAPKKAPASWGAAHPPGGPLKLTGIFLLFAVGQSTSVRAVARNSASVTVAAATAVFTLRATQTRALTTEHRAISITTEESFSPF